MFKLFDKYRQMLCIFKKTCILKVYSKRSEGETHEKQKEQKQIKSTGNSSRNGNVDGSNRSDTWALTRTDYKSDFKATFVGNRNVEATIEGASYLSTADGVELVEQLDTVTFTKSSTKSTETADFKNTVSVVNVNEYAYYDFKVTNNSTSKTYTDLIIEPVLTSENTEVTTSIYYAVGEGEYKVLTEDYLTAHQNESVSVRVVAMLLGEEEDVTFSGNLQLNLFTEVDKPTGYTTEYEYSVVDGVAYRAPVCTTCGKVGTAVAMEEGSYVIATPETAQDVLDSDINGKTVVFDAGTYSNYLSIGASAETSKAYAHEEGTTHGYGEELALSELSSDASTRYHYSRTIENVTLAGTENAVMDSGFIVLANAFWAYGEQYANIVAYDPIRKIPTRNFAQHLKVDNLNFTNFNFANSANIMFSSNHHLDIKLKNITVSNCSFVNEGDLVKTSAFVVGHQGTDEEKVSNLTFKNNVVEGYYWGVQTYDTVNLEILNNTFKNTEDSAICLRTAGTTYYSAGDFIIKNNTIDGCLGTLNEEEGVSGSYAITVMRSKDANVVIENNSFKNSVKTYENGDPSELLLIENNVANTGLSFINNTYEGELMTNTASANIDSSNYKITL